MIDPLAIIDLGTNTFHLLIVDPKQGLNAPPRYRESRAVRIGQGGITRRVLTPDAIARALDALHHFGLVLAEYGIAPPQVLAFGTSAIRNATNAVDFCQIVKEQTGLTIQVIDGNQEAEYIYYGVREAIGLSEAPTLIVDIGGGSVECIIGTDRQILWKQSFEIGGQRLMDTFVRTDPMAAAERRRLYHYFEEELIPLTNAIHQYAPATLAGASGSFDTLVAMQQLHHTGQWPDAARSDFTLSLPEFYRSYELLVSLDRAERLALPGMLELRVDMIVVAVCLIDYLLKTYHIQRIQVSGYSLKEGVLARYLIAE